VLGWQWEGDRLCPLPPLRDRPWDKVRNGIKLQDEATAVAQLQVHLRAAIASQTADLKRDQPVGVFLSGGLDSTVVAALLVQAGLRVRAYSLDFGDFGQSELPYAEQVAAALKIPLVKVPASPRQIRKALDPTVRALGMPFGDGVTVPLYLLGQAAAKEVQVVFNGEGGDQLFAGWTNKPLVAAGVYDAGMDWGLAKTSPSSSFVQAYLQTFHRLWGYETQAFVPAIAQQVRSYAVTDWLGEALSPARPGEELLDRLRRANLMLKGAQNIHLRATALAAVHGLQVRSPFCDLPLAQWTFQLEGPLLLQGACEKFILKQAIASMVPELPAEVIWRTKRGMGVPLSAWCYQDFWGDLGQWLNPERLRAEGLWQPDVAATIVAGRLGAGIQGRRVGEILWLLVIWELWRQAVWGGGSAMTDGDAAGKRGLSWDHPFWRPQWLWRFQQSLGD
jgi:asparagine synthase (glutamine-hydrolysing)